MDLHQLKIDSQALFGLELTGAQLNALGAYGRLLGEWNARFNLTALRDPESVRVRHFLDSLACLPQMGAAGVDLVDVGSGAGFPGLVLKIAAPQHRLTLVESVAKKARFCKMVAAELGLEGVSVLTERVEVAGQDPAYRERYDWAIARALAPMPVLAEYLLPLVKVGGHVLAQKGPDGGEEAQTARGAIELLGGRIRGVQPVSLPGLDQGHTLVILDKAAPTPGRYPRRTGVPTKRPLVG